MEREKSYEDRLNRERSSFFQTRFIRFLGGKNLLFLLITLLLAGCIIFVFNQVDFIFYPLQVLFEVVILPGVLAIIGYYLLRPFVRLADKSGKGKVPRSIVILILYVIVAALMTLLSLLVYPFLRDQFTNLVEEFPMYFMQFVETSVTFLNNSSFDELFTKFNFDYDKMLTNVTDDLVTTMRDTLTNIASSVATGITGFVSTLTGILLSLVTVPFILFYLLYEGEKLPKFILRIFPPRARNEVGQVLKEMDKQVSSYILGQILVSICIGVMMTIGFLIIKLDYAFLLGILAMVTSVVPYLGPVIAITPALIIAIVTSPIMVVYLIIVWTVVQLVEGKFITPNIMGKSLSIHPITIIFVLLTFGSLFGVAGVILGIPAYALFKVLVSHLFGLVRRRYNRYERDIENKYDI
ncbi:AI-2E family transporter [Ureibacillus chungkukjangi]|uniref:Putative PurR-regulated permease PerM n=1 Tax=Ureibacillus chungkukjangi TaxID=1202712 RepID=A0A318TRR1_9BACL|nr:AI-2E family transporter [Ureibacillus chungkukjangi]PYF05718.1 putative PurR-regulated permease PerM [Ureibacillus chungkukjangi]